MKHPTAFLCATILLLLAWHGYASLVVQSSIVLPTPAEVATAFIAKWPAISAGVGLTMFESLAGFLVALLAGYGTALAFYLAPFLRAGFYPYAVVLKATPLIAIAPILVIWTGDGIMSKIVMSALVAYFPILVASFSGLNRYSEDALLFYRTLGASRRYILLQIIIPGSLPHLFSGMKIASTLAVVGAVIAEFVGAQTGAGHLIKTSSYYLDTDVVFATIILLGLASVVFFQCVMLTEKKIVFWEQVD